MINQKIRIINHKTKLRAVERFILDQFIVEISALIKSEWKL